MSDHLLEPTILLKIAGKEYALDGSFNTLKALQQGFDKDIMDVWASVIHMRLDEFTKLVTMLIQCSGKSADESVIGQWIVDEVDVLGKEYRLLKAQVMNFLLLAMTPKIDRQKKRVELAEMIESMRLNSLGLNTEDSALAS